MAIFYESLSFHDGIIKGMQIKINKLIPWMLWTSHECDVQLSTCKHPQSKYSGYKCYARFLCKGSFHKSMVEFASRFHIVNTIVVFGSVHSLINNDQKQVRANEYCNYQKAQD